MSLFSSLRAFQQTLCQDMALTRMGAPLGWLTYLHYQGRWADRENHTPPLKPLSLKVNDRPVKLSLSAAYEGAFKGVFLDHEYQCASSLTSVPARIVDLGANIGMGAVYLHTQFPNAEFICVEPDPRNLSILRSNLESNQVRAVIQEAAIGAESGMLQLRFGKDPTCSALETSTMHQLENTVPVMVKTMAEVLNEIGWKGVDLLKIDIEGVEDELLSSHNEWLQYVEYIILEIHPNTTPERIASYLQPFGFNLKRVGFGCEPVYFAARPTRLS